MKDIKPSIEVDVKQLRAALKDVVGMVEARNTVPILSNVLVSASSSSLSITGTDLDCYVERSSAIADLAPGPAFTVTVHAQTFGRIVDKLPTEARAKLVLDDGQLAVSAGRSRFQLPTLPVDDFPAIPSGDWDAEFEIQAIVLGKALGSVLHAISSDETRYYLNGVFVHAVDDDLSLRFATTDGHRLARARIDAPDGALLMPDVIIPRKAVKTLSSLLDRHEGAVTMSVCARRLQFELGETTLTTKTIDGTFPDYVRVIPIGTDKLLQVDREALVDAIGRVTTVSSDKTRAVKMLVARDLITLSVASPEHGQAVEELPCSYSGDELTVGFNSKYWLDSLAQMTADTIDGRFVDGAAPSLWRDGEDSPALFVLMPLRV